MTKSPAAAKAVKAAETPRHADRSGQLPAGEYASLKVRLGDLGLAPENLRFDEPADPDIPQLADTLDAAGVLVPLIVRRGAKGEPPFMTLDGRRRRMGLLLRRDRGDIDDDYQVDCRLAVSKAGQAAALVLPNTERAPIHTAAVIAAIGKFRALGLDTAAIARSLGYEVLEIRRLQALAGVDAAVLTAFRQGKLTLKQVRLLARIDDRAQQADLAKAVLDGHLQDYQLRAKDEGGRVTVADPRLGLVGLERYLAAGGGTSSDLFGEMPDEILKPDLLEQLWRQCGEPLGEAFRAQGLQVFVGADAGIRAPDGFETLPYVWHGDLTEGQIAARASAREAVTAASQALMARTLHDEETRQAIVAVLSAERDLAAAGLRGRAIGAVLLSPHERLGVEATFYAAPRPQDEVKDDADGADEAAVRSRAPVIADPPDVVDIPVRVEVDGAGHALHETRTDMATRGLIRDLADHPLAALIALTAQLFKALALRGVTRTSDSALAVEAAGYVRGRLPAHPALDGVVRERLAARREAYLASGLRPILFVAALPHGERMALLGELVAVSLDLREARNTLIRSAARAEAREIAALCDADLSVHWCADVPFLALHAKKQLLAMLAAMGVEDDRASGLKKDELVTLVAEAAAARRWVPSALTWGPAEEEADEEADERASLAVLDPAQDGAASPQEPLASEAAPAVAA